MKKLSYLMALGLIGTLLTMPLISKAETVTVVYDSNASSIRNGYYTATLSNGTVIGFSVSSSAATFQGAISQKTSVSIPDTIVYTNNYSNTYKYPVRYIGYNNGLDFDNAQSVTSLTLPATITGLYAMAPNIKTLHVKSYINGNYVSTNSLSELTKVLVPSSTLSSYYGNSYWYNYVLINAEGTSPLKITINMTKPGEFAQLLLQKTDDWMKVNELTVIGELNTDDLNVFKRMRQLTKLDLSGATIIDIPNNFDLDNYYGIGFGILETLKLPNLNSIGQYAFAYCNKLTSITMPNINTIGQYAFQNCSKLLNISLPNGITSIGQYAFQNSGLKSISIPNSMTSISSNCFSDCANLTSATIPSSVAEIGSSAFYNTPLTTINLPGVKVINSSAFQNCKHLTKVTFAEGLWKLTGSPFSGCTALTEIDLPASLLEVNGAAFGNCTGIKKVISRAATAPTHGNGNALLYGCDMTDVKLYVPAMSIDTYRAQNGWKTFYTILPLEDKLSNVFIYDEESISDASQFANNCDFTLGWVNQYRNGSSQYYCGAVDYNGSTTLSLGDYLQYHYLGSANNNYYSYYDQYSYNARHTSLIANGTIRANSVTTILQTNSTYLWYFITLPYDVKVSDIAYTDGTQFVIRSYSGYNRANQSGSTWQNLTNDSIMHAYEGYILKCNKQDAIFEFPAINNSNKNKVFEKGNVVKPLGEYLSEFEHNRSWNLIGNPYPCYYDTRYMDFTAPITVWNRYNSRYDAYSPIDDSFILHPAQAFFVQRPVGKPNITFNKEGRQKNATVRSMNNAPRRIASNRELYNVYLQSGDNEDHTRFVFNDDASRSYELDKDASKLIADGNSSLLIYTVENGVKYAINERDLADGTVHLGFYAPEDGEYRLSLESNATETATLIDHENDIHSSMIGDYVFKAKAGYNDARFALVFGQSGIIEVDNDNIKIDVNDGLVSANVRCNVYTIDGRMVGTCDADNTINLAKGIYVISGNNVTRKIVVK